MIHPQPSFDQLMANAQTLHAERQWVVAREVWQSAQAIAPDPSEAARAQRGEAVSWYRAGDDPLGAHALALAAWETHANIARESEPTRHDLSERMESARVAGRMGLHLALLAQRTAGSTLDTRVRIRQAIHLIEEAYACAQTLVVLDVQLSQGHINLLPDLAIAKSFDSGTNHMSDTELRYIAGFARRWAARSEDTRTPGNAGLGRKHRLIAGVKARYRAYAATAITWLAPRERDSTRHRIAVRIATLPYVL